MRKHSRALRWYLENLAENISVPLPPGLSHAEKMIAQGREAEYLRKPNIKPKQKAMAERRT